MNPGRYYLSAAAQATLRAHNTAARARLALKREERAATEHEFDAAPKEMRNVLVLADFRHADKRFTGEQITNWGGL